MTAGSLSRETLTKAYLARIALTNAEGPSIQAVRELNPNAVDEAAALDAERASSGVRGPLHGIPVLVDDTIDATGCRRRRARSRCRTPARRRTPRSSPSSRRPGAIVLGKTNVSELNGLFDANMPEGYSSLGGQVLMASDTDNTPGRLLGGFGCGDRRRPGGDDRRPGDLARHGADDRSGGRRRCGRAEAYGRPRVPRRRAPVAKSQDSPGPIARTVGDAATPLRRSRAATRDTATTGAPAGPNYVAG